MGFFCSKWGFCPGWKVQIGTKIIAVDRARRAVLAVQGVEIGVHCTGNPFKKYSNPDLRYPT